MMQQEELIADARDLSASPAFRKVLSRLQDRYVAALLVEPVGSLTAATAHASLKVIGDIETEMRSLANEGIRSRRLG